MKKKLFDTNNFFFNLLQMLQNNKVEKEPYIKWQQFNLDESCDEQSVHLYQLPSSRISIL